MRPSADTLLVWTGPACSYGCGACPIDARSATAGTPLVDLQQGLSGVPARRGRLAVLVGGEPCLRPDVLRLMAAIRAAGCVPGMITTGRALVYPQMRERLRRVGLAYLRAQLFGLGAAHDRTVAVPGAFGQVLEGLRACIAEMSPACDVDVALSFRGRSIDSIAGEVEDLARQLSSPQVQIVVAIDPPAAAAMDVEEALRQASAALAHWNDDPTRPLLAWEGVSGTASSICPTIPFLRPSFVAEAAPSSCCLGTVAGLAAAPTAAVPQPRANSFNFVRTATTVPWTDSPEACTAHAAAGIDDPCRNLWFVENGQLVQYVTDTSDFATHEIARVKEAWSHLFLDRAPAGVLDDFTHGMRRVLPETTCDSCTHRERCGRRFRVVEGPPFAREEAWIATHVAGLRGRVLDVGCGEQLYQSQLAPLLRAGIVDYTGLDPDEQSLARLHAVLPQARFNAGGIEDFWDDPASYDSILCLRSLNHVRDVDEALARMARLLKPGGSLLLVECTPFALLRRAEQVAAADRAPRAGHQHLRNLASEEVLPLARRRSLRVVHHHPAALKTTNEWILLLARPRDDR
jgi:2-polyprenyl-3-methyl-5-hydroxy-6-metoxy-1,4-benzoquinol methylase